MGAPCDPAAPVCPSGQQCVASGGGGICTTTDPVGTDAPQPPADGDGNTARCYGTGMLHDLCFPAPLTGDLSLAGDNVIDTDNVGTGGCTEILPQDAGPSLCVLEAGTISISGVVSVHGPNPLVLIADQSIDIPGTIDASSHLGGSTGPGARSTCTGNGGKSAAAVPAGGGGGAGGSFGSAGGDGEAGAGGTLGGKALVPTPVTVVTGGCRGGTGGDGVGGGGEGAGGQGGGAVYLIAGGSISIPGTVAASGAGGRFGGPGVDSGAGAGGGGSGGFIGFDAPSIDITGFVHANGGGGGGGNGDNPDGAGKSGKDPTVVLVAAAGGDGGVGGGGHGGSGFAEGSPSHDGDPASAELCGGGGGGGGGGIVRVFGASIAGAGQISPAPQ